MEQRPPPKIARFLVWCSAKDEYREDILIAFDEMHSRTAEQFGYNYANCRSLLQGAKSLPYGMIAGAIRLASLAAKLVS